ncbi:hypothetical protein L8N14_007150 [Serratia marcescens]|uniref:hypothetical protein n=1 Tax=Serratia marcescens TaxID=615 RepID=UPI001C95795D|nr:hypothetical protein [Serratia marcescens]MBY4847837.1 hypothetical protein [Serratia marcescens]MCH9865843.1 hypothetical protein [Serratia marcescens]
MTAAINTGKSYSGFRPALDLSASILDPSALFSAYKARVVADGGSIPDEPGCLARFGFLVNNGMYSRATFCAAPAFGLKVDGAGNVQTVYNLLGAAGDLIAGSQGTPPLPMTYDATARAVIIQITSSGGWYLKSRTNLVIHKGSTYLIAGRMSDLNRADNNGITASYNLTGLPMAYIRTMITNNSAVTEAWRYGSRDSAWPAGSGGAIIAATNIYADYVPSAGLFKVDQGVIEGYEKGKLLATSAPAATGKLADLSSYTTPMLIGGTQLANNIVSACYGAFQDMLCLHTADESDAILASRLGM